MRRLFSIVAVVLFAAPLSAQTTFTVTPANTHQTWRFFGGDAPIKEFDDANCTTITALQMTQGVGALVDAGVNFGQIDFPAISSVFETRDGGSTWSNSNTNPSVIDLTGFTYSNSYTITGSSCTRTNNSLFSGLSSLRSAVKSALLPFYAEFRLGVPQSITTVTPIWVYSGASGNNGVDFASRWFQATTDYLFNNFGFCFDQGTVNEPDNAKNMYTTATGVGAASWWPGVVNSFASRIASDAHCSSMTMTGPTDANPANVLSDLSTNFGAVSGSEANLSWITYHSYFSTFPPADGGLSIWTHANGEGKQAAETELCEGGGCAIGSGADFPAAINVLVNFYLPLIDSGNISGLLKLAIWGPCYASVTCAIPSTGGGGWIGWGTASSSGGTSPGIYLNPLYWVTRQLTKYVQPGYVRVDASTSVSTNPISAWKRPDGSLVVLLVNQGAVQNFTISGLNNVAHRIHKLDPNLCNNSAGLVSGVANRCTPDDSSTLTPSGGSLTLTNVPASAVWTLDQIPPASPQSVTTGVSFSGGVLIQ